VRTRYLVAITKTRLAVVEVDAESPEHARNSAEHMAGDSTWGPEDGWQSYSITAEVLEVLAPTHARTHTHLRVLP